MQQPGNIKVKNVIIRQKLKLFTKISAIVGHPLGVAICMRLQSSCCILLRSVIQLKAN